MLGIQDAAHAESNPQAPRPLIGRLSCSLVGQRETIDVKPGTLVHRIYGQAQVVETYACSYGLNPEYRERIGRGMLQVVGRNAEGAVRAVELASHRFFIASLFLPQASSTPEEPHPLIEAYLRAATI